MILIIYFHILMAIFLIASGDYKKDEHIGSLIFVIIIAILLAPVLLMIQFGASYRNWSINYNNLNNKL